MPKSTETKSHEGDHVLEETPSKAIPDDTVPSGEADIQKESQKERLIYSVISLLRDVKQTLKPTLNDDDIQNLSLKVEELDITDHGDTSTWSFFEPLSRDDLQNHPIDLTRFGLFSAADCLCTMIAWQSAGAKRIAIPEGHGKTLASLTGWRHQEGFTERVFKDDYWDSTFSGVYSRFCATGVWESRGPGEKAPHVILLLKNDLVKEDKLLRGELLIILAAMETRLTHDMFKKHLVIPVTVLSFMGQHGRIIKAYHDGENLILRKSKLLEFFTADTAPIDLFVRHASSKRVGNTKQLPTMVKDQQEAVSQSRPEYQPDPGLKDSL
ncbi:hypothetical protein MW887_004615 [Aspergillus wentii]|nr:hypothetical protein MW887_004615 [Aspergillus wentii]